MAATLADVFDTTEVSPIEEPEEDDEDVEALMEALYGETQETKNWCKDNAGGIEEDEEAALDEEVVDEEYINYEETKVLPSSQVPLQQGENFLEILEQSAAGKHENFKGHQDSPTWRDELRRTAEAAAANVEASLGEGSKKIEVTMTSGMRFLAYGVMFASIITILAKASISHEQTAAEAVSAAIATTSAHKLQLSNEELKTPIVATADTNKMDATGEFAEIDEEDESISTDLSDLAKKHLREEPNSDTDLAKQIEHRSNSDSESKEQEKRKKSHKQKVSEIEKVVEMAKELALKEGAKIEGQGGQVKDLGAAQEALKILEAAQRLEAKEEAEEVKPQVKDRVEAQEKALDSLTQTNLEEAAKKEEHPDSKALQDDIQDETMRRAAEEERIRLAHKASLAKIAAQREAHQRKIDQFRANSAKTQETKESYRNKEEDHELPPQLRYSQELPPQLRSSDPDHHDECTAWAKRGECKNNKVWMMTNCATSCSKHYILDLNPQCPQWAEHGECERNHIYMAHHCPASCGGLHAPAPAPKAEHFSPAKRAAELQKQSKPKLKAHVVRGRDVVGGKEIANSIDADLSPPKTFKDHEKSLLDMLANIPSA